MLGGGGCFKSSPIAGKITLRGVVNHGLVVRPPNSGIIKNCGGGVIIGPGGASKNMPPKMNTLNMYIKMIVMYQIGRIVVKSRSTSNPGGQPPRLKKKPVLAVDVLQMFHFGRYGQ